MEWRADLLDVFPTDRRSQSIPLHELPLLCLPGWMILMAGKVEEKLQEQTATTAFQLVWGGIKGLGGLVVDENAVQRGMKEYARKFLERYGNIKILNMDQPVPLGEIYVAAQVLSPRSMKRFTSVNELHEMFLQQGQRRLSSGDREGRRHDCLELANKVQQLNTTASGARRVSREASWVA